MDSALQTSAYLADICRIRCESLSTWNNYWNFKRFAAIGCIMTHEGFPY
jgi:hypothetical protein